MLGWRRRRDGFEWREYVRTTILVRRKNRRDRIVRAGNAAVDGLKVAGERGVAAGAMGAQAMGRAAKVAGHQGIAMGAVGAQALGRGAKVASHQGLAMSIAGWRAADNKVRASLPVIWEATQLFAHKVISALVAFGALAFAAAVRLTEVSAPHAVADVGPPAAALRQAAPPGYHGGARGCCRRRPHWLLPPHRRQRDQCRDRRRACHWNRHRGHAGCGLACRPARMARRCLAR